MSTDVYVDRIAGELSLQPGQVRATAALLAEGGTVPFIARYRKEATGQMDEVAVLAVRDRLEQLAELDKRREAILKSLQEHGKLTDELQQAVLGAQTLTKLEDIYLPHRPKRRTRGMIAREKGLAPLAEAILEQGDLDPAAAAAAYVDADKGVDSAEDALAGARDIIAEQVNEDPAAREDLRRLFADEAVIRSKVIGGKEEAGAKFRDYFDWSEPASAAPSHRTLAMRRGEAEGVLSLRVLPEEDRALGLLERRYVRGGGAAVEQVRLAVRDCYKRLIGASMETEARLECKKRAEAEAIRVFAENMRELLLAPPLGQKNVLALDPGFRTGCKVVCLDRQGKLLQTATIYPHPPANRAAEAGAVVRALCEKFRIEAIAVGSGTAGRETEAFCRGLEIPTGPTIVMVNESGASVYSASEIAREEFPEHDLTVRGSVSIGRRLMDPLAELVKIDPKSVGVGQYQHDVDRRELKKALDDTVVSCVNAVGVEVNTASAPLLSYVSGLGPQLAGNIVKHRDENGPFPSRAALKKVPRLGPKAFEQAAGFLRVRDGKNPLDASAVHPESYGLVDRMARDLGCRVADLTRDAELRARIRPEQYVTDTVGLPTLTDILAELAKPGRDPREKFEVFAFDDGVHEITDLAVGMKLPGIVTNVTRFGAFVDVGVHQDGLIHVSQLADRYVKDPADVVKVQQKVHVTVMEIDLDRRRIALSMRANPLEKTQPNQRPAPAPKPPRGKPPAKPPRQEKPDGNNPFGDFFKGRDITRE